MSSEEDFTDYSFEDDDEPKMIPEEVRLLISGLSYSHTTPPQFSDYSENEDDAPRKKKSPPPSASKHVPAKKKNSKGKIVSFDHIDIPMGSKDTIDKFVSWRENESGEVEILIKYKVVLSISLFL